MDKIRSFIAKHEILVFFLLAYAITWAIWIPSYLLNNAGVISAWGAFGPALAGIFITRFMSPQRNGKVPRAAFLIGLVVSTLVYLLLASMQLRLPWPRETVIGLILVGLLSGIAPSFVISSAFSRHEAVRDYLQSLIKPRGSTVYYLLALLLVPLTFWLGAVISDAFGQATLYETPALHGWELFVSS